MAAPVVTTRAVTEDDGPLLFDMFAESGAVPALLAGIDPHLLRLQFRAQQIGYASQFPGAVHEIVLIDGTPVGQVRWTELANEVHVIDISVLARFRRRGIATTAYRAITARAAAQGK